MAIKKIQKKKKGAKRRDESTPRGQWRWKFLNFFLYYSKLERLVERSLKDFLPISLYTVYSVPITTNLFIFSKKKKGVHSEISLWRDEAWFCRGMIGTECWRRDGPVADSSSFSIFWISPAIFSINSDSRLQMRAKPQIFFF